MRLIDNMSVSDDVRKPRLDLQTRVLALRNTRLELLQRTYLVGSSLGRRRLLVRIVGLDLLLKGGVLLRQHNFGFRRPFEQRALSHDFPHFHKCPLCFWYLLNLAHRACDHHLYGFVERVKTLDVELAERRREADVKVVVGVRVGNVDLSFRRSDQNERRWGDVAATDLLEVKIIGDT